MSAPLLMILMGTVELAIGVAIGWFLAQSEHFRGLQPSRSMLDSLKNAVGALQDHSRHARELTHNLKELNELISAPVADRLAEQQLTAHALLLSDNLEQELRAAELRIRQKIDEYESRLAPRDNRFGETTPAPRARFDEPEGIDPAPEPVAEIIGQLKDSQSEEVERRNSPRYKSAVPLMVTPLDEKFKPVGNQFRAVSRDISTRGISYVHSSPAQSNLVLIELHPQEGTPKCVLVEVIRSEPFGSSYVTAGRFIAQVPQALALSAAHGDDGSG